MSAENEQPQQTRDVARTATASAALMSLLLIALAPASADAQQLEPRAYSPAPIGLNFLGVASSYSSGGVVTDATSPVQNVDGEVIGMAPFYARTLGVFGRLASVGVALPFASATAEGEVQEVRRSVDRFGLLDPQMRLAVNLLGGPALTPAEFRSHEQRTTLGASLTVVAPFGEYDGSKLINLGTNRWAYKTELGLSHPVGRWAFELYAGVWIFEDNDDYFGGQRREQDPLESYQAHAVYNFRPNLWIAADYTYYTGGATTLNGQAKQDRQDNTRGGLTLSVPLTRSQSFKIAYARGVSTRVGSSFQTIGVTWQWVWL